MTIGRAPNCMPAQPYADYLHVHTLLGLSPGGRDAECCPGREALTFDAQLLADRQVETNSELESGRDGRRGNALVALTEAGQTGVGLTVASLEVGLAATTDIHLAARHHRLHAWFATGAGSDILRLRLTQFLRGVGRGNCSCTSGGHGFTRKFVMSNRFGPLINPSDMSYCPSIRARARSGVASMSDAVADCGAGRTVTRVWTELCRPRRPPQ